MTQPMEQSDRPYIKDKIRIDSEGYVHAPTKPGLGYEIDRDVLDNMITAIET
jgi:L-alanine-DL-glutamate epimerase-like enolase superfamily enzyme